MMLRLSTTVALAIALSPVPALAGNLVYQPINPGFGGFSNNIDYLLPLAQLQNQHVDSGGGGGGGGGAPAISFPPITIDLGGAGTPAATPPAATPPAAAPQMTVGN